MGNEWQGCNTAEKSAGLVLVDLKLNMSPWNNIIGNKTNSAISKLQEVILPLYSGLVNPHLKSNAPTGSKKDFGKMLEESRGQQRT